MENFAKLEHEVRTVALVGTFLQLWALLEHRINEAMGKALGLDDLQTLIISRNAQFTAKTHILSTAIWHNEKAQMSEDEKTRFQKTLTAIQAYSPIRNMMAHDLFLASETTDGVDFNVVKAKGKLKIPDVTWDVKTFSQEFQKLHSWRDEIKSLIEMLTPITLNKLLAYSLANPTSPNLGLFGLGGLDREYPQTPGILGSIPDEAIPQTDGETPQDAPE